MRPEALSSTFVLADATRDARAAIEDVDAAVDRLMDDNRLFDDVTR